MPTQKQAQPPPRDDPEQSEKFVNFAAELEAEGGADLFERAMDLLATPAKLPVLEQQPIINPQMAKKKAVAKRRKNGSTD
jgi:hypothetical protein